MKKILILGVNGFIGHHLPSACMRRPTTDWEVYGMDSVRARGSTLLKHPLSILRRRRSRSAAECASNIRIRKVRRDHLPLVAIATPATYVKEPLRVFELDFEANLPIVRSCVKYKKRILFPSTSEVYGMCRDGEFDSRGQTSWRADREAQRWI